MSRKSRTKSKTRANAKTRTKKAVTATAKNTDTEKTTISTVENTDEKTTAVKAVKKTEEKQIVPTVKKTEEKKADIPTVKDTEEKKAAASTEKKAAKKKKAVSTAKKEDTKKETVPVEQEVVAKQEAPVEQEQPKEYVDLGPRRSVVFIGSECYPFVKTGGLGDVMSALPKSLAKLNVDVKVILPRYKCIPLGISRKRWSIKALLYEPFALMENNTMLVLWNIRKTALFMILSTMTNFSPGVIHIQI